MCALDLHTPLGAILQYDGYLDVVLEDGTEWRVEIEPALCDDLVNVTLACQDAVDSLATEQDGLEINGLIIFFLWLGHVYLFFFFFFETESLLDI